MSAAERYEDELGGHYDETTGNALSAAPDVIEIRRNAGVAALVGVLASGVAIAYLARAAQTGAVLDWVLFGVMTVHRRGLPARVPGRAHAAAARRRAGGPAPAGPGLARPAVGSAGRRPAHPAPRPVPRRPPGAAPAQHRARAQRAGRVRPPPEPPQREDVRRALRAAAGSLDPGHRRHRGPDHRAAPAGRRRHPHHRDRSPRPPHPPSRHKMCRVTPSRGRRAGTRCAGSPDRASRRSSVEDEVEAELGARGRGRGAHPAAARPAPEPGRGDQQAGHPHLHPSRARRGRGRRAEVEQDERGRGCRATRLSSSPRPGSSPAPPRRRCARPPAPSAPRCVPTYPPRTTPRSARAASSVAPAA